MELFRALCAVAEDNAAVLAAHPTYASLVERTLSKVVLVHVAGLERLCQVRRLCLPSATLFRPWHTHVQRSFLGR